MRVRVFIDYWNFQLAWNERTGRQARVRLAPIAVGALR